MTKNRFSFLSAFLILWMGADGIASTFPERFAHEQRRAAHPIPPLKPLPPEVNQETIEALAEVQVVLVPGLLHGVSKHTGYYTTFQDELEVTFKASSTPIWVTYSHNSIEENAELLKKELEALHAKSGKPLLVIAHSKGASELFLLFLKYPELFLGDMFERIVLVQASIGGSPLAEDCDPRMGLCGKIAATPWRILRWVTSSCLGKGYQDIRPANAKALFDSAYEGFLEKVRKLSSDGIPKANISPGAHPSAISVQIQPEIPSSEKDDAAFKANFEKLSKKVVFIRTRQKELEKTIGLCAVYAACPNRFPEEDAKNHDGLLTPEAQYYRDDQDTVAWDDWGILEGVGHSDLFLEGWPDSRSWLLLPAPDKRRPFTRATIKHLFRHKLKKPEGDAKMVKSVDW